MLMMFHRVTLYITRAAILWLTCYLLLQRKHNPSDQSSLKAHDDRGINYARPSMQSSGIIFSYNFQHLHPNFTHHCHIFLV